MATGSILTLASSFLCTSAQITVSSYIDIKLSWTLHLTVFIALISRSRPAFHGRNAATTRRITARGSSDSGHAGSLVRALQRHRAQASDPRARGAPKQDRGRGREIEGGH